jgi:hypothetical protein
LLTRLLCTPAWYPVIKLCFTTLPSKTVDRLGIFKGLLISGNKGARIILSAALCRPIDYRLMSAESAAKCPYCSRFGKFTPIFGLFFEFQVFYYRNGLETKLSSTIFGGSGVRISGFVDFFQQRPNIGAIWTLTETQIWAQDFQSGWKL